MLTKKDMLNRFHLHKMGTREGRAAEFQRIWLINRNHKYDPKDFVRAVVIEMMKGTRKDCRDKIKGTKWKSATDAVTAEILPRYDELCKQALELHEWQAALIEVKKRFEEHVTHLTTDELKKMPLTVSEFGWHLHERVIEKIRKEAA